MQICIYCLGKKALLAVKGLPDTLIAAIDMLVIGTDKNVEEDYAAEIKAWAVNHNINHCFKNEAPGNINSRFHIAIGWRWLINAPTGQDVIVFHDSLLPLYRGYNPLVTALINGDTTIGATCFLATAEMDAGPVIAQEKLSINYPLKIEAAIDKMGAAYAAILPGLISTLKKNEAITGTVQNEAAATYSLWRDEADYKIDWTQSAGYINRFIDATGYPYKGAFFYYGDKKIRVTEAATIPDVVISNRDCGKLFKKINDNPVIVCGSGLLELKKMTDEDGNTFTFNAFRVRL